MDGKTAKFCPKHSNEAIENNVAERNRIRGPIGQASVGCANSKTNPAATNAGRQPTSSFQLLSECDGVRERIKAPAVTCSAAMHQRTSEPASGGNVKPNHAQEKNDRPKTTLARRS